MSMMRAKRVLNNVDAIPGLRVRRGLHAGRGLHPLRSMHKIRGLLLICGLLVGMLFLAACAGTPSEQDDQAEAAPRCPASRASSGILCPEIVRYARDPATGQCCRYDSVCEAPSGWKTYTGRSACEDKGKSENKGDK